MGPRNACFSCVSPPNASLATFLDRNHKTGEGPAHGLGDLAQVRQPTPTFQRFGIVNRLFQAQQALSLVVELQRPLVPMDFHRGQVMLQTPHLPAYFGSTATPVVVALGRYLSEGVAGCRKSSSTAPRPVGFACGPKAVDTPRPRPRARQRDNCGSVPVGNTM